LPAEKRVVAAWLLFLTISKADGKPLLLAAALSKLNAIPRQRDQVADLRVPEFGDSCFHLWNRLE
jgi:hypothetical protein